VSFLYNDQDAYTFMDLENYEQYILPIQNLEEQASWLVDGLEGITALLLNGNAMAIELPTTMDLAIVETEPVIKGATATNRNKPAVLENGVTVKVPEYLAEGDVIRVNTETGNYMGRAKD
jgi:elongation factor P